MCPVAPPVSTDAYLRPRRLRVLAPRFVPECRPLALGWSSGSLTDVVGVIPCLEHNIENASGENLSLQASSPLSRDSASSNKACTRFSDSSMGVTAAMRFPNSCLRVVGLSTHETDNEKHSHLRDNPWNHPNWCHTGGTISQDPPGNTIPHPRISAATQAFPS